MADDQFKMAGICREHFKANPQQLRGLSPFQSLFDLFKPAGRGKNKKELIKTKTLAVWQLIDLIAAARGKPGEKLEVSFFPLFFQWITAESRIAMHPHGTRF